MTEFEVSNFVEIAALLNDVFRKIDQYLHHVARQHAKSRVASEKDGLFLRLVWCLFFMYVSYSIIYRYW